MTARLVLMQDERPLRADARQNRDRILAAAIPALLEEISMEDEEIRAVSDPGVKQIQELIDTAKRDGTLRRDVTFADIGTLTVRLSRPLPGTFTRELNDSLGHRHLDLL